MTKYESRSCSKCIAWDRGGNGELLRQQESVTNAPPKYGRVQTFARRDAFTPGCTHDNTCLRACVGAHVHTLTNSCCVKHYLNTIRMHSPAAQFASLSLCLGISPWLVSTLVKGLFTHKHNKAPNRRLRWVAKL